MLGIHTHLQTILNNIFIELNKGKRDTTQNSPQFNNGTDKNSRANQLISKSPLQAKLYKYEIESDLIEDSSPIKDKVVNEYKPVDHRAMKYFTLDQEEEELQKRYEKKSGSR